MDAPLLLAGAIAIVLIGKPLSALVLVWAMRYPFKVALTVSTALAQIGEFSFILATLGRELNILPATASNTLVAASMVSIVLNPILYRSIDTVDRAVSTRPALWRLLNRNVSADDELTVSATDQNVSPAHRAVLIGYGPTGRTVVRLLRENDVQPTVIELNIDTVRSLRQDGVDAIYGDATAKDTLEGAGMAKAGSLILTSAGMANSAQVIKFARELNPNIRVLARAAYLRDLEHLQAAGADSVYSGEGEVALAFVEDIMDRLGATPEQIDRERARAHEELFAGLG